jgi:hypothetical protein
VIPPNPLPEGDHPPPGPTLSTASGAFGTSCRAGRASRAQPPSYANPGYATVEAERLGLGYQGLVHMADLLASTPTMWKVKVCKSLNFGCIHLNLFYA